MTFDPKFTDLHLSPKEMQLRKSYGSFGEECTPVRKNVANYSIISMWGGMVSNPLG